MNEFNPTCEVQWNRNFSFLASRAQTLLAEDSEAHLLESVAPQPRQHHIVEQHIINDNYKSNGESTRSSTPGALSNDNPVNLSMRREFQPPNVDKELSMEPKSMEISSASGSLYNIGNSKCKVFFILGIFLELFF